MSVTPGHATVFCDISKLLVRHLTTSFLSDLPEYHEQACEPSPPTAVLRNLAQGMVGVGSYLSSKTLGHNTCLVFLSLSLLSFLSFSLPILCLVKSPLLCAFLVLSFFTHEEGG